MNLRFRLLTNNLLILALGLISTGMIANGYKAHQFPRQVQQVGKHSQESAKQKGVAPDTDALSFETIDLFHKINNQGTAFALVVGFVGAGTLGLWTTYSILRPLKRIEESAKQFSSGDLNARVPPSNIPEIHHLGLTLNSVATRLQGVEERRRALISDLAHELNTPLTVIQGYAEMLESGQLQLNPEVSRQIHEEAQRMSRLVADLKLLSSVETGNVSLRLQPLYPRPILQNVVATFKKRGWHTDCSLDLDCPPRLPMIFADPDRFRRILNNLISNALAYTPEGKVTVRASVVNECLWIEVKDNGIGISQEDLPHVFERFWRSPASRHLRFDGSGIGLAISKRLVEVMGGQIEVESQLGHGSTFKFSMPLASLNHWQVQNAIAAGSAMSSDRDFETPDDESALLNQDLSEALDNPDPVEADNASES